jgi:N-acetylneuraminic acid mutarotase
MCKNKFLFKKPQLIPFALKYYLENYLKKPDRILAGSDIAISEPMGTWQKLPDIPSYRYEFGGTYLNGKIYLIGGLTVPSVYNVTRLCETYNVENHKWQRIKNFPRIIHHPSVIALNEKIYVIGGNGLRITPYAFTYVYDPLTNAWEQKKSMFTARGALGIAEVNGIIYAIGGGTHKIAQNTNEAYNAESDSWTKLAPMLTRREHLSVASASGLVFAMGGYKKSLSECTDANEAYNPEKDMWEKRSPLPLKISGFASCTIGDSIFIFGGEQGWSVSGECFEYKVKEDKWYRRENIPTPRYACVAINANGKIHLIGGNSILKGYIFSLAHEIFIP